MSYKVQVKETGEHKFYDCGDLRFLTIEEAEGYSKLILDRIAVVSKTRIVESTDPPKHRWNPKRGVWKIRQKRHSGVLV